MLLWFPRQYCQNGWSSLTPFGWPNDQLWLISSISSLWSGNIFFFFLHCCKDMFPNGSWVSRTCTALFESSLTTFGNLTNIIRVIMNYLLKPHEHVLYYSCHHESALNTFRTCSILFMSSLKNTETPHRHSLYHS